MNILNKHLVLLLALCVTSSVFAKEEKKNSLRKSTTQLARTTASHAHGALCSAAQGADHLLYPALCFFAGRAAYNSRINAKLLNAPQHLQDLEKNIPGGDMARHAVTYVVVGGALCAGLNYLSNITEVNEFMQTNMPHLAALLQHVKTELSYGTSTRK